MAHAKGGGQVGGWLREALQMGTLFLNEWEIIRSQGSGEGLAVSVVEIAGAKAW